MCIRDRDGTPIEAGEIAGPVITGHDNFQNAQAFLNGGGRRGLQEQILLSGTWNLNPWFVQVEQVPMVQIPIGYVGVVISYVGKAHVDVSGVEFKHGDLVNTGHKGVWITPLYPGKHPINTRVMKVELVPTTNIVLNLSLIHISEPTRLLSISYAVFCLKKKTPHPRPWARARPARPAARPACRRSSPRVRR